MSFNNLEEKGFLFETLAIRDLRIYAEALDGTVYHYRDKTELECDAVLHLRISQPTGHHNHERALFSNGPYRCRPVCIQKRRWRFCSPNWMPKTIRGTLKQVMTQAASLKPVCGVNQALFESSKLLNSVSSNAFLLIERVHIIA